MPLMIGSDAAFSLPCWGSSMAIVTLPFEVSPAGCGVLGVSPPVPPLAAADGAAELLPVLLHAANARTATLASTLTLRKFIHCPPHHRSAGSSPADLGRSVHGPSGPVPALASGARWPGFGVGRALSW